jgi:hypothetical protein
MVNIASLARRKNKIRFENLEKEERLAMLRLRWKENNYYGIHEE